MTSARSRLARAGALVGSALALATLLASPFAGASSHREGPLIAADPTVDNTDVYAFRSPDDPNKVTLIANWIPFEEPGGGPNFYHFSDTARYWIYVDQDGDTNPDIKYLWTFDTDIQNDQTFLYNDGQITSINDQNYNYRQRYTVRKYFPGGPADGQVLVDNKLMPPDNIGPRSTPDYDDLADDGIYTSGQTKVFTGQREDPFYVDVQSIFDLLGLRPFNSAHAIKLKDDRGLDTTGGFNIHTTAVQEPLDNLKPTGCNLSGANAATNPACVIGIWSTAERPKTTVLKPGGIDSTSSDFVQISRLGNPLVNEVVMNLALKDTFNAVPPSVDRTVPAVVNRVTDPEVPRLYCILYGIDSPGLPCNNNTPGARTAPRNDLVAVFLTGFTVPNTLTTQQQQSVDKPSEQLRLNLAIAPTAGVCQGNRLGVIGGDLAGWPNGRRLEDDVTDIILRAAAGGYALTPSHANQFPNNALSDGVDENDVECLSSFPYIGTPHQGYEHDHHAEGEKKVKKPKKE